jgi:dTDP-4-amino-4,6-dideoxygalactose transaminase
MQPKKFEIDLFRPSVPPLEAYTSYLKLMDEKRMFSNFGPLHNTFANRLSQQFEVEEKNVTLFSSGTMALTAALHSLKKPGKPYCLLPSWTFVASAQAVLAAGLIPIFVDVNINSMQIGRDDLLSVPPDLIKETSVLLLVSPFGAPMEVDGFEEIAQKYDFSVLCDCAAGFDSINRPVFHSVVSLHATKTFGIGEGGALISKDDALAISSKSYTNFGFEGGRSSLFEGVNGKLSEVHASIGLGALDVWPESKGLYYSKSNVYLTKASNLGQICSFQSGWGVNWVSSTCVVRFKSKSLKTDAARLLDEAGIQTRDWWNGGCHKEPAFSLTKTVGDLPNTDILAETTLGIPFYRDIEDSKIDKIIHTLELLTKH